MVSKAAIQIEGLWKRYRIGARAERYRTLRDTIASLAQRPFRAAMRGTAEPNGNQNRWIWALRDVSLEIPRGSIVGIMGRNGAGKSTLLKVLSLITEPTRGFAEIRGRVGSLLEVGTGFHLELTGRENIYLNGAILGMRRREIDSKFDEIVAFAEVEKFTDTPVKFYSSGMYLRLAFAVAAHLETEILLVDEVLAVGDVNFQRKCLGKMGDVAQEGRTVLFVSHNMAALRHLCRTGYLLDNGSVARFGKINDVVGAYLDGAGPSHASNLDLIRDRKGAGQARFSAIRFEDGNGQPATGLVSGEPGRMVLGLKSKGDLKKIRVSITLLDSYDQKIMHLDSKLLGHHIEAVPQDGELVCEIPRVHLAPGRYRIALWLQVRSELQDHITDAGAVDVTDGNFFGAGRALIDGYQVALMDFGWRARQGARRAELCV